MFNLRKTKRTAKFGGLEPRSYEDKWGIVETRNRPEKSRDVESSSEYGDLSGG